MARVVVIAARRSRALSTSCLRRCNSNSCSKAVSWATRRLLSLPCPSSSSCATRRLPFLRRCLSTDHPRTTSAFWRDFTLFIKDLGDRGRSPFLPSPSSDRLDEGVPDTTFEPFGALQHYRRHASSIGTQPLRTASTTAALRRTVHSDGNSGIEPNASALL